MTIGGITEIVSTNYQRQETLVSYEYPASKPEIVVWGLKGPTDSFEVVNRVWLQDNPTKRGLKAGDNFEKMVKLYGEPNITKDDFMLVVTYRLNNKQMEIITDLQKTSIQTIDFKLLSGEQVMIEEAKEKYLK